MSTSSRARLWRALGLSVLFLAMVAAVLHPTPHQMSDTLPNLGDPAFVTRTLASGSHSLTNDPLGYHDPGFYWGHEDVLTYSDPLTPLVPVYAVVHGLTGDDALAFNVVMVLLLVGSLAAAYLLAMFLTGSRPASVLGATAFTFSGYMLTHLVHLQLLSVGLLALGFLCTFRMLERRSVGRAMAWGVVNACVLTTALYYGAIYAVSLGIVLGGYLLMARFRPGPGLVRALAIGGAVTVVLAGPILLPYAGDHGETGLHRPLIPEFGLNPQDLLSPPATTRFLGFLPDPTGRDTVEHRFYPGFVAVLLAGAGVVGLVLAARVRRRDDDRPDGGAAHEAVVSDDAASPIDENVDAPHPDDLVAAGASPMDIAGRRRFLWLLVAAGAVATVLALGPTILGRAAPYRLLYDHVPGFDGIRVSARLAVVGLLAGAMLAAWGFAWVTRRWPSGWRLGVTAVLLAMMLIEAQVRLQWDDVPSSPSRLAVYEALQGRPGGAVVELPMPDPSVDGARWGYVESTRLLLGAIDWHPRVNGYSGYVPGDYLVNRADLVQLPDPVAIERARRMGVRWFVLHTGSESGYSAYTEAEAQAIVDGLPDGVTATRHGDAWLVDLGR